MKLTINQKILIFFLLVISEFIIDITTVTKKCNTLKSKSFLFLHHMISVYGYFGCFLFNPIYHFLSLIGVLIHWKTNNNRCEFTVITNKQCGYDESRVFNDFFNMTLSRIGINRYEIVVTLMIYDIVMIYLNRKKLSWNPLTR